MSKEADNIVRYLLRVSTPEKDAMPFIKQWNGETGKTEYVKAMGGYLDSFTFADEATTVIDEAIDKIKHDADMRAEMAIKDAKIEAYELALTHTRPPERTREEEE